MNASLWQRLVRGIKRVRQRADWPNLAGPNWADRIMDLAVTDDFHAKQGRSTGRLVLQSEAGRLAVYLKRHYRLPRWHGLLATLWPGQDWSPAFQEARHLDWAQQHGLPVPTVVAAGETIGPWGRLQSFLAVEELTGMLPLHVAIPAAAAQLHPSSFAGWKRGLTLEMARLTRELHLRCCFHKDLYLCHFYLPLIDTQTIPVRWHGRLHLIDLHRLGHHPLMWRWWQVKDLGELLFSSELAGITPRDRLRFWRAYRGLDLQLDATWLRKMVLFRWRQYRRQHERRQAAA